MALPASLHRGFEAAERRCLVVVGFEDAQQLGYLQQVIDPLLQVQEFHSTPAIGHGCVTAHQLPESGGFDVGDVREIQQYVLLVTGERFADGLENPSAIRPE